MALRIERIPTWKDNYSYLLVCDETGEAAVVDAPEVEPIAKRVAATGARVTQILSTHHHPDHSMANPDLAKQFGVPVLGHVSDRERLPGFTRGLEEGDTIAVGKQVARVLFIPAHTRGHIAYVFDAAQAVFTGDTMFAAGCGRLFEGNPQMMFDAFAKLGALPVGAASPDHPILMKSVFVKFALGRIHQAEHTSAPPVFRAHFLSPYFSIL